MKNQQLFVISLMTLLTVLMALGCSGNSGANITDNQNEVALTDAETANSSANKVTESADDDPEKKTKVTFIELGSVRCIPCQKMVPIMESVEKKFGDQIKVVFYDVWTPEGRPYGEKYKIRAIPTQVFLDEKGDEYFRHEGFFPEDELVEVLKIKGVR